MITPDSFSQVAAVSSHAEGDTPCIGVVSSVDLLAHGKLIHIQHRGELYSLRETRLGKLILTK